MSRIAIVVAMLCALLIATVQGYWEYQGTTSYISQPDSYYAPDGTSWWSCKGSGTVSGTPHRLVASGETWGNCGVDLWPIEDSGLSRSVYVQSQALGVSDYTWVPRQGDSREVGFAFEVTISTGGVSYDGYAVDDTHVSVVSSTAKGGASGEGYTVFGSGYSLKPYGKGSGWATTQTGSGASNDAHLVSVGRDETDWWFPPPLLYNVGYEGALEFTCSQTLVIPPVDTNGDRFSVIAVVGGYGDTDVDIEINDPNYYYLYGGAEVTYSINGETEVNLSGDIQ